MMLSLFLLFDTSMPLTLFSRLVTSLAELDIKHSRSLYQLMCVVIFCHLPKMKTGFTDVLQL